MYPKRRSPILYLLATVFCALALLPSGVRALSSDRGKPVEIEADQVEINQNTGIAVYEGNVVVRQGTLRISADKLTAYLEQGKLTRLVAEGSPATYSQQPDKRDQPVKATALVMEYEAGRDTVVLEEQARLEQGDNTFASNRIVYNRRLDQVEAGRKQGGDRVRITIEPRDASPADTQ